MWGRRTSERAQSAVLGLYPFWAVEQRCVDVADTWLEAEEQPPALRRLISEGRAGVVRALAARNLDRENEARA